LYPIEKSFKENKNICHSETWLGNQNTKFIVDGIDLSKDNIIKSEEKFIKGLRKIS